VIILALDTATPVTSVALLDDNQFLGQVSEPSKNHSRTLLIAIDRLVSQLGLARHDLGAIAVGLGPGSFTGIRVGLTLAKSLSFALRIPLAGVSTLRALAENGKSQGAEWICPALDALRNEVYSACYLERQGSLSVVQAEAAREPHDWALELSASGKKCLLLGSGVKRYPEIFEDQLGNSAIVVPEERLHVISAVAIGFLAREKLQLGASDDPHKLEPMYCRLSEAELVRNSKM